MAQPWRSTTVQRRLAAEAEQAATTQPAPTAPAASTQAAAAAPSGGAAAAPGGESTRPSHACQLRLQPVPASWTAPAAGKVTLSSVLAGFSAFERWAGECKDVMGAGASSCDLEGAAILLSALCDVFGVRSGDWGCDQHAGEDGMAGRAVLPALQQQREQQPSGAQPSSSQRSEGAAQGCMGDMGGHAAQPGAAQQPPDQPSKPEQPPKQQRKRGRRGGQREQARRARAQPMRAAAPARARPAVAAVCSTIRLIAQDAMRTAASLAGGGQQRQPGAQLPAPRGNTRRGGEPRGGKQRSVERRSGQLGAQQPRGGERSAAGGPAAGKVLGKHSRASSAARSIDALSVHSDGSAVHMDT